MKKITLFALGAILISVNVSAETYNGHEYVDLGLSVMWATCNVGAENSEDYGNYYAWGETTTKSTYDWSTSKYWDYDTDSLTKYTGSDGVVTLEVDDDAAHVNWGGDWRMPTITEMQELLDEKNCTWSWTDDYNGTGVAGRIITSKTNGNSIFLPAAGYRYDSQLSSDGSYGGYWSSSLRTDNPYYAYDVGFNSGAYNLTYDEWYYGQSVRAVVETSKVTTAIENVEIEKAQVRKVMENGVIYIVHPNGEKYTLTGQRTK